MRVGLSMVSAVVERVYGPNRLMMRLANDCLGTYSPAVTTVQLTRIESCHTESWRPCRCKASTFIKVSKAIYVESLN